MPRGGFAGHLAQIKHSKIELAPSLKVIGYHVEVWIQLWCDDHQEFRSYKFQLDTKADVTTVPDNWLTGNRRRFGALSQSINADIQTSIGKRPGEGRMARKVRFRLTGDYRENQMDMWVSTALETDFGLFSLHDLHNNYAVWTEGVINRDFDGTPITLGYLCMDQRKEPPA
jgi:hypothetical protein